MDSNVMNAYEAKKVMTDDELLDMLNNCSNSIVADAQILRTTGTEVESIKRIQGSLVLMCAAIQVFAPDMMNIDYSTAANKTIFAWKSFRGGNI